MIEQIKKIEESWLSLDSIRDVIRFTQTKSLKDFLPIWWHIFLWHCVSSIVICGICGTICFYLLRRHKFGRFFSILIVIWGVLSPIVPGVISSIFIAWIQSVSVAISPLVAFFWGCGLTLLGIFLGVTRILATL
ncbi:hypothetical protein ACKWTF_014655 [Chironomus riparius]